jgi:hypothetical protein
MTSYAALWLVDDTDNIASSGMSVALRGKMPKMRKEADLPTKIYATFGLSFALRKKWEKVRQEVKYCSDRRRTGAQHARTTHA